MAMALKRHFWTILGIATALAFVPVRGADAAPQALALLELDGPTPLVCENGLCKAEFTTYCLQQDRPLPATGTAYELTEDQPVHLALTAADGSVRHIPAAPHVRIRTSRAGHTAVVIEIPQDTLASLGAQHAAIDVGAHATMLPVPVPGDLHPLTEQEKALASGPLRALGARIVDRVGPSMDRVRVLNRLVNTMPDAIQTDPAARSRLWKRALDLGFADMPAGRRDAAHREYAACWQDRVVSLGGYSVRNCLQRQHDQLMWGHGQRYWDAVEAGS